MKTPKAVLRGCATLLTAGAMVMAGAGIATAAEANTNHISVTLTNTLTGFTFGASPDYARHSVLSNAETDKLADDLEVLFTRYIQLGDNDVFVVNEANLIADGHQSDVKYLRRLAEGLNALSKNKTSASANFPEQSAIKPLGGPVGIGVALGWAAWSCRGKL